ncbi:MAG: hypothetical protein WD426_08315 [Anditalea sp.]
MDDIKIDSIITVVADYNKQAVNETDRKLDAFLQAFKKEFNSDNILIEAETITWALFQPVLSLYANGNNSSVIIELYSILEKFIIHIFPKIVSKDKKAYSVVHNLVERKNLLDIAPILVELRVWTSTDLVKLKHLVKLRNGIAQKNEKLISKALNGGKETHYLDINQIVEKFDTISYILLSVKLLVKLTDIMKDENLYS